MGARLTGTEGVGQLLGKLGKSDGEHYYGESDQLDGEFEKWIGTLGQALFDELQQKYQQHAERRHKSYCADIPQIHGRRMLGNIS